MEDFSDIWPYSDVPSDLISIYDGTDAFLDDYAEADPVERVLFCAYWLQAEVLNGGLGQFFSNSTGVLAPEAVEACLALGLPELAARLEEGMAWFGEPYPRDRGPREAAVAKFIRANPTLDSPFDELDKAVVALIYDEASGLESSAKAFIEKNGS